jgi:uncharacterized protein
MGNAVLHFEIQAREPKKLNEFYSSLFEWKIDDSNPMSYGMVDTGTDEGIRGGIGPAPMGDGGPTFYVQVPDLEVALARVEELGGKRVRGPMDVPGGPSIAMFEDLEGNTIGLLK